MNSVNVSSKTIPMTKCTYRDIYELVVDCLKMNKNVCDFYAWVTIRFINACEDEKRAPVGLLREKRNIT